MTIDRISRAGRSLLALAASFPIGAQVVLPPVNLGGTSFTDGVAGPGLLFQPIVLEIYHATRFADATGVARPGPNTIDTRSNLFHVAYFSTHRLLGAFYGAEVLLPVASVNMSAAFGPKVDESGFGDMLVSPLLLEWEQRSLYGRTVFSRFAFLTRLPTGAYSPDRPVNIGSNSTGAIAYYAFTVFVVPRIETSWRLQYLWNGANPDPFRPLGASSTQAGRAFHLNYATSYEISHTLRLGINGYFLRQLSEHRLGGTAIPQSKEHVFALGPGATVSVGLWRLTANADIESQARNRPQGLRVNATIQRIFPRVIPGAP